jgi:hypothetical protein
MARVSYVGSSAILPPRRSFHPFETAIPRHNIASKPNKPSAILPPDQPTDPNVPSHLLNVPSEIRSYIFSYLVTTNRGTPLDPQRANWQGWVKPLHSMALLLTCKSISEDLLDLLYGSNICFINLSRWPLF